MSSHLPTAAGFSPLPHGCHTALQLRRSPSLSPCLSPAPTLTPSLSPSPPSSSFNPLSCPHPCLHHGLVPVSVPIPVPISLFLGPSFPLHLGSHFQPVSPMAKVALSSGTEQITENKQTKNAKTDKKHFYFLSMTRLPACLGVTLFQACLLFMFRYIYIN